MGNSVLPVNMGKFINIVIEWPTVVGRQSMLTLEFSFSNFMDFNPYFTIHTDHINLFHCCLTAFKSFSKPVRHTEFSIISSL